ncbi:MAG: sugar ABC transporter ATP-binding protein [Oscillospiraceae bacterium]|jgi:ABC-type sugar transport system ATPase subunit|nr:sugar ABC transporter ATP-binding protein [Oscillospiraceae bacterium]
MEQFLEFAGIGKSFPGVRALNDISFRVQRGKVLALLGENGAGKSTLLKIMSGDLKADEGTITLDGKEMNFNSPNDAIKAGISVIYQERQLIPSLSVAENIFPGELPRNKIGLLDRPQLKRQTQELIDKFGLSIDPSVPVGSLSVAYQQMVEIIKAYRRNSDVIAFDEPTAPLTDTEITILFNLIRQLKEEGKMILYVSHRLNEIFQVTDEIVVLKDGQLVATLKTAETTEADLIHSMVGRDIGDTYSSLSRNDKIGDVLLEVTNLATPYVSDISFKLHKGEIVGFAGLVGAGRSEVMRGIFGADPVLAGEVKLNGEIVNFKSPKDAIDAGIALCPEDRKEQGLVLFSSIKNNVSAPVIDKLSNSIFRNPKLEEEIAQAAIDKFSIKTPNSEKMCLELSGGNQQKVILGRWTSPLVTTNILILDEPTKGIDVGTKQEIYQMVCDFAKQGMGVIFVSSEMPEVIGVSDTIIVMHNGHITGTTTRADNPTEESVLAMAMLD